MIGKLPQNPISCQPGDRNLAARGLVRRPLVIATLPDDSGSYQIVVDMADKLEKIVVGVDEDGFVSSLKQVTRFLLSCIDITSVVKAEILTPLSFCKNPFAGFFYLTCCLVYAKYVLIG